MPRLRFSLNQFLVFVTLLLLTLILYKNISYPLLWNDEAETAVYGSRVLKYGFPKVHDKNTLNLSVGDKSLGVKESIDASIHLPWGQYYFATLGIILSNYTSDIYVKTGLVRIPFVIIGLLGIIILGYSILPYFKSLKQKYLFLVIYYLLNISSVPLLLHLREARSYSITLFLINICIFVYLNYFIFHKISSKNFLIAELIFLFSLFNTFIPAYFVTLFVFTFHNLFVFRAKYLKIVAILFFVSLSTTLPLVIFYETLKISQDLLIFYAEQGNYIDKLSYLLSYFSLFDGLLFYACFATLIFLQKVKTQFKETSSLFLIFFLAYALIIPFLPVLFERYFIVIQPLLTILILLNFIALSKSKKIAFFKSRNKVKFVYYNSNPIYILLIILASPLIILRIYFLYVYSIELFKPYRGVLDYTIPYIKNNFNNYENLKIYTNYEEASYIFYLGSYLYSYEDKLLTDKTIKPDIIIPRQWESNDAYASEIIPSLKMRGSYKEISFDVRDYPVNNIPEMHRWPIHLFQTLTTTDNDKKLKIYIKEALIL